jgi:hypothetical protein
LRKEGGEGVESLAVGLACSPRRRHGLIFFWGGKSAGGLGQLKGRRVCGGLIMGAVIGGLR